MRYHEPGSESAQQRNQKDAAPLNSRSLFLAHPVTLISHNHDRHHTFFELLSAKHRAVCVKDILLFSPP